MKCKYNSEINVFAVVVDSEGRLKLSTLACSNLMMLQKTSEMQGLAYRHEMIVLQFAGM